MATTQLNLISSRNLDKAHVFASVSSVALDAAVSELFQLPVGFGDIAIERCVASVDALSGAYVATAPARDGLFLSILDTNSTTVVDILFARQSVVVSTSNARPELYVSWDFSRPVYFKNRELIQVAGPIIAGAGVTGRVALRITGPRYRQS